MALITETWQGDVLVIRIEESPLIDAKTIQQFQNELLATLEKTTASQVLLDFGQVKSMSSAALGALVRANRKCKERRMALKLINLAPSVREVFRITGLDRALHMSGHDDDPPTHGEVFAKIKPWPSGGTTVRDVDPEEE